MNQPCLFKAADRCGEFVWESKAALEILWPWDECGSSAIPSWDWESYACCFLPHKYAHLCLRVSCWCPLWSTISLLLCQGGSAVKWCWSLNNKLIICSWPWTRASVKGKYMVHGINCGGYAACVYTYPVVYIV
jgi:hypothetical protein